MTIGEKEKPRRDGLMIMARNSIVGAVMAS